MMLSVVAVGGVESGIGGVCLSRFGGGVVYGKACWFGCCK